MMTGETWQEQTAFEGVASTIVVVTGISDCTDKSYEIRVDCLGLDSFSGAVPMAFYIWSERTDGSAREDYTSMFKVGSYWRISGKIEYVESEIQFIDPVYMPYQGVACETLKRAHMQQDKS